MNWMFENGYDSGNILASVPDARRAHLESLIRGCYRCAFFAAVKPYLRDDSRILEVGPGRGSWTKAMLAHIPRGELHAVDVHPVAEWLDAGQYAGRLTLHRSPDGSLDCVPDGYFDFCFSFGVCCHYPPAQVATLLAAMLPKAKPGAVAVHHFSDWSKLDALGWPTSCGIPREFRNEPGAHGVNWWPRNDPTTMARIAAEAGWKVESADLGLFDRDSVALLRRAH